MVVPYRAASSTQSEGGEGEESVLDAFAFISIKVKCEGALCAFQSLQSLTFPSPGNGIDTSEIIPITVNFFFLASLLSTWKERRKERKRKILLKIFMSHN